MKRRMYLNNDLLILNFSFRYIASHNLVLFTSTVSLKMSRSARVQRHPRLPPDPLKAARCEEISG